MTGVQHRQLILFYQSQVQEISNDSLRRAVKLNATGLNNIYFAMLGLILPLRPMAQAIQLRQSGGAL